MSDSQEPAQDSTPVTGRADARPERIMKISPLDMRQQRFKKAFRGYDPTEVVAFLTESADDYEQALREIDLLRQDLSRMETVLGEHRQREAVLRDTLLTAQHLADDLKQQAQTEAQLIIRDAEGRARGLLDRATTRLGEIERDIKELRLRRRGVEGSLEASIQALYHALEFIREQDQPAEERPAGPSPSRPAEPAPAPRAAPAAPAVAIMASPPQLPATPPATQTAGAHASDGSGAGT